MKTYQAVAVMIAAVLMAASAFGQERKPVDRALIERIDALSREYYKPNAPGAVVFVTEKKRGVFQHAYGNADVEEQKVMMPDMQFAVGTLTRKYIALATLSLEEQGMLSLSDPISKYFKYFPSQGETITIGHLLVHTSGLPDVTASTEWMSEWNGKIDEVKLRRFIRSAGFAFAAGEKESFNNTNYIILAMILEKVTGDSYEEVLEDQVFDRAEMKDTRFVGEKGVLAMIPKGYRLDENGFREAAAQNPCQAYGTCSVITCARELYRLNAALFSGKLLKQSTLEKALAPAVLNNGERSQYCMFGTVEARHLPGHPSYAFVGNTRGHQVVERYYPEDDVYVLIMTNSVPEPSVANLYNTKAITQKIGRIMFGIPLPTEETVSPELTLAR